MLTKKNKRMVRKMRKYIRTFPLTEREINQMVEDITGMAEEAQERNEDLETVLGKSVRGFCDDLIYSVGGIKAPGGRKLIRGTSIYFQLLGLWGIVGCLINVCFLDGERIHALWILAFSIGIYLSTREWLHLSALENTPRRNLQELTHKIIDRSQITTTVKYLYSYIQPLTSEIS